MSSILCRRFCGAAASIALIASIAAATAKFSFSSSSVSSQALRDGTAATLDLSDARTIVALVLGAVGASISSAGGIGGGGLFVPLFNLLLGFNTRTAAVLSNFMIFGGMVANMMWSSFQRDPLDDDRPLIDFDAAMLMQPNMLLGISLGVLCNLMFPGWLITLLLTVTLGFVTIRSAKCGFRLWKAESSSKSADPDDLEAKNAIFHGLDAPLLDPATDPPKDERNPDDSDPPRAEENPPRDRPDRRCVGFPALKLSGLLLVWLFFFAVQLFRGSKNNEGYFHLEECGTGYWLITASQLPLTLVFTVWTIRQVTVSNAMGS